MRGQQVTSPSGEQIVLVDIGLVELVDDDAVRVWDVSLDPGAVHPWHLHHNPYVVLSVNGSEGRMDWLDGSPPRFISEYRGGAVYRPVSPVHRLTNIGDRFYRNRLVELKDLGEHPHVSVWTVTLEGGERRQLELTDVRHVVASLDPPSLEDDATAGVRSHPGGPLELVNQLRAAQTWSVVELTYLDSLTTILDGAAS